STWNPKATAISVLAENHFISNSSAATFQAIRAGAGIGSLPTFVKVLAPELVMLALEPWGDPGVFLCHPRGIEHLKRVQLVKQWLLEMFDPTDQPWFRQEFIHPKEFEKFSSNIRPLVA